MASGAVYTMANNDGQMDELLYMSGLLAKRINEITQTRMMAYENMTAKGIDTSNFSINPTIADIESSHNLFVSKSYRPYVMIAFEYLRNRPSSGNSNWGNDLLFYPRVFGEFMSDTALYVDLGVFNFTDVELQTIVDAANTGTSNAVLPWNTTHTITPTTGGTGTSTSTQNYLTTQTGAVLMDRSQWQIAGLANTTSSLNAALYPTPIYVRNYIQYAEFPMHRLITNVAFQVNSTDIDSYGSETDSFFVLFELIPNKKENYYKCVGQELPVAGYSALVTNDDPSLGNPAYVPNPAQSASINVARQQIGLVNGFQTPKYCQPDFTGFYPNKFDHCNGIRNAIPVLALPNAERAFIYSFCTQLDMFYASPSVFTKTVTTTWSWSANTATPAAAFITEIQNNVSATSIVPVPTATIGGTLNGPTQINNVVMYINNVFVDPSIHDIYLERIGFSLTRVHRSQQIQMNTNQLEQTVTQFKWPIEFFFLGLRPASSTTSPLSQRNWWRFATTTAETGTSWVNVNGFQLSNALTVAGAGFTSATVIPTFGIGGNAISQNFTGPTDILSWDLRVPSIATLKVSLQTIQLYDAYSSQFYNAYLPFTFGGHSISGTEDVSALFITFCFFPNDNGSPSGHVNASRSREFTINITSNTVGYSAPTPGNPTVDQSGTIFAVANVINFWLISSGNLFLRFS
jgi:hypothetical protein